MHFSHLELQLYNNKECPNKNVTEEQIVEQTFIPELTSFRIHWLHVDDQCKIWVQELEVEYPQTLKSLK